MIRLEYFQESTGLARARISCELTYGYLHRYLKFALADQYKHGEAFKNGVNRHLEDGQLTARGSLYRQTPFYYTFFLHRSSGNRSSLLYRMKTSKVIECLQVPTAKGTSSSPWINDDIRPMPPHRRQWGKLAFISFWAINQIVCLVVSSLFSVLTIPSA